MLLTFSALALADEGRYTIINAYDTTESGAVYVLNTKDGSIKFCRYSVRKQEVICTKWFKNDD